MVLHNEIIELLSHIEGAYEEINKIKDLKKYIK